uniref:thiol oxidase n=1 Tax=viral metagenome TaxID=1070528 RepID=A0A6C0IIY3_9ZZZZ
MLMRFHNARAIVKHNSNDQINQTAQTTIPLRMNRMITKQPVKPTNDIHNVQKTDGIRLVWGEPIWFLFHTLAEKIKDEHFLSKKNDIINLIKSICANLPCPKCTDHATDYMNKLNIESIKTKRDLKDLLYKFHNDVNKRKNFSEFPHEELDAKYKSASTVKVINYFISSYKEKSRNVQMIATELSRMRVLRHAQQWLTNNLSCFDM